MKRKTTGKRLTRKTTLIPEEGDELEECIKQSFDFLTEGQPKEDLGNGKTKYGQTFHEWLIDFKDKQEQFLKNEGLPYKSTMWQIRDNEQEYIWLMEKPESSLIRGTRKLDDYFEKNLDLAHDSMECLTAKILVKLERLIKLNIPAKVENGYRDTYFLSELITKRLIYALETDRQKENAKKSRSPLKPLIKKLAEQDGTAKEKWPTLITMMENQGMDTEEIDDNGKRRLDYYDCNDKPRSIAFTTFRNKLSKETNK